MSNSKSQGKFNEKLNEEEVIIPVPWGHISGKRWGSKSKQPILCLHGWMDNAGTFARLVPQLCDDHSFLSIDLPGHGSSSHFPKGRYYYNYWDGVMLLRRIVKYFKWSKVKLLGHSMGAGICFLYAGIFPNEVEFFVSLDFASASVRTVEELTNKTHSYIDDTIKCDDLQPMSYECEEIVDKFTNSYKGSLTRESAEILLIRGTKPAPDGKLYFAADNRLKAACLDVPSLEYSLALASKIVCPYLNIQAKQGARNGEPQEYETTLKVIEKNSKKFQHVLIEGTHHVHLNNPERLVPAIESFLS